MYHAQGSVVLRSLGCTSIAQATHTKTRFIHSPIVYYTEIRFGNGTTCSVHTRTCFWLHTRKHLSLTCTTLKYVSALAPYIAHVYTYVHKNAFLPQNIYPVTMGWVTSCQVKEKIVFLHDFFAKNAGQTRTPRIAKTSHSHCSERQSKLFLHSTPVLMKASRGHSCEQTSFTPIPSLEYIPLRSRQGGLVCLGMPSLVTLDLL